MNQDGHSWFVGMKMALAVAIIGFGIGLIAKESRNKTYKLLFSAPVSTMSIILGKYFALVGCFVLASVVSTIICLIVRVCFGGIFTVSEFIFGILAMACLIMLFASIVIFISTWCSNVGVLCSICYGGYFITTLGDAYMSSMGADNFWVKLYAIFIQFSRPFYKLMFGVIGIETFLYFASMIVGLLFLSKKFLESKRFV